MNTAPRKPDYTPDEIESLLLAPLREVTTEFESQLERWRDAIKNGDVDHPTLPLPIGGKTTGAKHAIVVLRKFLRAHLGERITQSCEGTLRRRSGVWRESKAGK